MTTRFNPADIRRFLSLIVEPSVGCTEFRVFKASHDFKTNKIVKFDKYEQTIAGWYDNANSLYCDINKLDYVSGYLTLNPVSKSYLSLKNNGFIRAKKDQCAIDDMIVCLRYFYIDIDAVIHPDGIPANGAELASAISVRDSILSDNKGILDNSAWGCSGNGAWILARLPDYPNDDKHRKIIEECTLSIKYKYSNPNIEIDARTKNPSRVMCLPGTLKCKGIPSVERPWRMVTIDGCNLDS